MELLPNNKTLKVSTAEPFGQLLLELMHGQSYDNDIYKVQRRVGELLISSYINTKAEDAEFFGVESEMPIFSEDIAKDMAIKIFAHARVNDIDMEFSEEYFDGLERISEREANDLPELRAEREVVAVAAEMGYIDRFGMPTDSQDIQMVDEEIEQAEAAIIVLEMLKKYKGKARS
jgi:hypothetical protein